MKKIIIDGDSIKLKYSLLKRIIKAGVPDGICYYWSNNTGKIILNLKAVYYNSLILLQWETLTGKGSQKVELTKGESNLGKGDIYYFLCSFSGKKCRTLYFIPDDRGGSFQSRYSIPHLYDYQRMSRKQRKERYMYTSLPDMGRRKYHYRGKITPIGRRYERLLSKSEEAEENFLSRLLDI